MSRAVPSKETSRRLPQVGTGGQQVGDRHRDAVEDLAHHLRAQPPAGLGDRTGGGHGIAAAAGAEAGQRLDHAGRDLLIVLAAEQRQAHDQADHHVRGQLAIGAAGLPAVLSHHLVDHIARDIGGQDPDGDQILHLPFPQPVLIHARHGGQPNRRMAHPQQQDQLMLRGIGWTLVPPSQTERAWGSGTLSSACDFSFDGHSVCLVVVGLLLW